MKIVIFCGGYGTRMWPVSRKSYPKQFFPLINGKSFFQLTFSRFRKVFDAEDIFVSTEEKYKHFVRKQAPEISLENIITEPERRDNLAAVGLATAIIQKRFPGEVMLVSWADHFISKVPKFLNAVLTAGEYAKETGLIVSVDEKPTYPSVHHGWVKLGKILRKVNGHKIVEIVRHIEKPKGEDAKKLFKEGGWLLNTGYRAWRADTMLLYFKEYVPSVYIGLNTIADSYGTASFHKVLEREYHKLKKDSIEYAIFEKLPEDQRATIPLEMGWEDAGTWELFYKARITKNMTTVVEGGVEVESIDAENNLIVGHKGKVIGIIGLSNIAVIDTPDGLLVCPMDKTDAVKEVFARLEKDKEEFVE